MVISRGNQKETWITQGSRGTGLKGAVVTPEGGTIEDAELLLQTTIILDISDDEELLYIFKDRVFWSCGEIAPTVGYDCASTCPLR
jgi:hypothetical protein